MTTRQTSTHFKVPVTPEHRAACLGPDGTAVHVIRVIRMIQGALEASDPVSPLRGTRHAVLTADARHARHFAENADLAFAGA